MAPAEKGIAVVEEITDPRAVALLQALGFDKLSPGQRELALSIANRYDLDPMLKHLVMIEGRVYITRDGLLHVAHRSGDFDGIEVDAPENDGKYWRARARVYRKSFSRPFVYPGRYPVQGRNAQYAEEMAIKVAEVMTLRRAFDVSAPVMEERWDGEEPTGDQVVEPATLAERIAIQASAVTSTSNAPSLTVVGVDAAGELEPVVEDEVVADDAPEDVQEAPEPPQNDPEPEADATASEPEPTPLAAPERERAGLSYTEFMELAKAYDRDFVRATAKAMFPGQSKFADLSQEDRQRLIDELAVRSELEDPPSASDPVVDPLFDGAPTRRDATGQTVELCGAVSPFDAASTCTLDAGHPVPVANGINHRAGVREAW